METCRKYTYQIYADVTSDLSAELLEGLPPLEIISMPLEIDGDEYQYGPNGNITVNEFYQMQRTGKFASTSQVNPTVFAEIFERSLEKELDVIYLAFSSGMSGTYQSAQLSMQALREKYPDRKVLCVDTLCGSVGEALLIHEALKKQQEGKCIQELYQWVLDHRMKVCHWFTVDTFEHLKHGGRVSSVSAAVGTALQIKPMLRIDENGTLKVVEKPRGRKKAISSKLARMEMGWDPNLSRTVVVGHGDCPEEAEKLVNAVKEKFPEADIYTSEIGPIIGAHTGPGMLALIYMGNNR